MKPRKAPYEYRPRMGKVDGEDKRRYTPDRIPKRLKSMKAIAMKMDEACQAAGVNFAERFVDLVQRFDDAELADPDIRLAAMKLILQAQEYIEPKKRATTITVNNRPPAELTEAELRELAGIIEQDGSGSGTTGEARSTVVPFRLRAADEFVSDAIETPRLPAE